MKKSPLSKCLAQYASMAGAFLAVSSARAQIVYTDLNPDIVLGPDSEFHLDLNNDGITDFVLGINKFLGSNSQPYFSMYINNEFNDAHSMVLVNPFIHAAGGTVKPLDYGYSINESLVKWDAQGMLGNKSNAVWNNQEEFAGLHMQFSGEPGIHSGWVRIAVQSVDVNNLSITIKDYAYNSVADQPILAGEGIPDACIDLYEPNNHFAKATSINTNEAVSALINPSGDRDFYQFSVTPGQPNILVVLSNLFTNYNLTLYNASKQIIDKEQSQNNVNDTIVYNNAAAGTYYIKVFQKNGGFDATNCYTLYVQTSLSPFKVLASRESADINDLKIFPNPANQFVILQINAQILNETPVHIFDLEGRETLKTFLPAETSSMRIDISSLSSGMYLMKAVIGNEVVIKKFSIAK